MKNILVCSDLLEDTLPALATARHYAVALRPENVSVTLLFVMDTPVSLVTPIGGLEAGWVDLEPTIQEGEKRAKERLGEIAASHFSEFSPEILVKRTVQSIPDEIVAIAEEQKFDLIVVAKHSRSGMERFLLGSVTTKVVQNARCAVLVVPIS